MFEQPFLTTLMTTFSRIISLYFYSLSIVIVQLKGKKYVITQNYLKLIVKISFFKKFNIHWMSNFTGKIWWFIHQSMPLTYPCL